MALSIFIQDNTVAVWDMNGLSDITHSGYLHHAAAVRAVALDNRYIISGSDDTTIVVSEKACS